MLTDTVSAQDLLHSLRQRWLGIALLSLLGLGMGTVFLASAWQPGYGLRWLVLAARSNGLFAVDGL